jgi:hypothetical protein
MSRYIKVGVGWVVVSLLGIVSLLLDLGPIHLGIEIPSFLGHYLVTLDCPCLTKGQLDYFRFASININITKCIEIIAPVGQWQVR